MHQQATRPHMRSRALLYQHTFAGFPTLVFSLFLYLSKYHIWCDDAPPGDVLCDHHLYLAIQVTNKLESVFGYPNHAANKNACLWLWGVLVQLLFWIFLLMCNYQSIGDLPSVGGPFLLTYSVLWHHLFHSDTGPWFMHWLQMTLHYRWRWISCAPLHCPS